MKSKNGENKTEISQRIAEIKTFFCNGNNGEFAQKLGVTEQYASNISNGTKSTGQKLLDKILEVFPEVSKSWLYFGVGEMLVATSEPREAESIDPQPIRKVSDDAQTIANLNDYIKVLKGRIAQLEEQLAAEREKATSSLGMTKEESILQ